MKLLLWLAVGVFVIWQLRGKKRVSSASEAHRDVARGEVKNSIAEPMIRCTHCDVYVPASDVIFNIAGAAFCSEEHRKVHI